MVVAKMKLLFLLLVGIGLPLSSLAFSTTHSSFVARPTNNERFRGSSSSQGTSLWSMHMGHSHSHHHHGHEHSSSAPSTSTPTLQSPTTVRRKITLVVFAACVVLAPRLVMKKSITRAHSATFALTCLALTMLNQIRSGFASIQEKFKVRKKSYWLIPGIATAWMHLCL